MQKIIYAMLDNELLDYTSQAMFWFLAFAEYIPFIVLLFTMWLSSRCQLNYLVCGYLYKMGEDDKSTVIGSVMFAELQ